MPTLVAGQRGIVFAVDGAGGFESTSEALRQVAAEAALPLEVESFWWSHGCGRVLADQVDFGHAQDQGRRLAYRVAAVRQLRPDAEVYLVGHSAGTAVVLAAAESLPPQSIDRIILLAPSVSACYDLRPALRASRGGIDCFYSSRDIAYLGIGTALVGTADRRLCPAAGRVGFCPRTATTADAALYTGLHQHPWDPSLGWTGHKGGHYGAYQLDHLKLFVLPLLHPGPT